MAHGQPDGEPSSIFPGFSGTLASDTAELMEELVRRRRQHGFSQTEVAARMGTSQSSVARLETGQADVRLSTLRRYAAALDADVSFAVHDDPEGERS